MFWVVGEYTSVASGNNKLVVGMHFVTFVAFQGVSVQFVKPPLSANLNCSFEGRNNNMVSAF